MVFIARLRLSNFRAFGDAELSFSETRTLIAGRNATGKSTIADAIAWCLTGRCRGTDAAGRGAAGLIRTGATSMRVAVDLITDDGPLVIVREADASARSTGLAIGTSDADLRRGPLVDLQSEVYRRLHVGAGVLAIACDGSAFFALDHAEAKDLLLAVLDVRVLIDERSVGLPELDQLSTQAQVERGAAKKALQSIGTVTAPPIPLQPPADALRTKADTLREQLAQARDVHAESRGRRAELTRRRRELEVGIQRLRDQDRVVGPSFAHDLEIAEKVLAHAICQRDELATQSPAPFIGQKIAPEWISRVQVHDPKDGCVFSASIPCKTAAAHFRTYVQQAHADVQKHAEVEQARASWRSQVAQQEREVDKLAREVEAKRAALETSTEMAALIADGEAKLAAVAADLDALAPEPEDGAPTADASVREQLAVIDRQLAAWADYDRAHTAFLSHRERSAALKADVARLEERCTQLGPRGLRAQALDRALGAFLASVNAVASRWGFAFGITPEPWAVTVNGRDVALLSASERLRVGLALQWAIVGAAGFGVAFVDAVDILDRANNAALAALVLDPTTDGQIVLAATREEDAVLPEVEGLQVVRLVREADGTSAIVDQSAVAVEA